MSRTALLVLAAGMGSRFGGSKQMFGVGPSGETILEYSVFDAVRAGFGRFVFVVTRQIEARFRAEVLSRLPASLDCRLAFQETTGRAKPWGTAHAALAAAKEIDCPFAVANADDFYGRESFRLVHDFLADRDPDAGRAGGAATWCLAGFRLANTTSPYGAVSRAICETDRHGALRDIVERRAISRMEGATPGAAYVSVEEGGLKSTYTGEELVSMNLWGLTPAFFPLAARAFEAFARERAASPSAEFGLPQFVGELIARGEAEVTVLRTPERWFGLTYREDIQAARDIARLRIREGGYPSALWGR